jgi:N-acetylglutamate synthase-like GNAT family acetyltransferase
MFTFSDDPNHIDLSRLQALFNAGAFWAQNRTLDGLARAIAHSNPVISLWDHNRLIGFARATSDWVYRANIWDVIIHPDYQGLGLGRQLIETLLAQPALWQVERIYLMTTYQQGFYEKIGFQLNSTATMRLDQTENNCLCAEFNARAFPTITLNEE